MNKHVLKILSAILVLFLLASCGNNTKNTPNDTNTDVLALLNAKIKKDPKNPDLYYQQAKFYYSQQRINDARSSCAHAIKLDDQNPDYFLLLSDINLAINEYDAAIQALQKVFELDPDNVQGHLKQAELSLLNKDYKRVDEETQIILGLDKLNASAYFLRGFSAKEQGDTSLAVRNYKKTIELDPENVLAYEELGILYALLKDESTVDYLNSAINLNPKNTVAMYALAMFYQETAQPEKAMEIYENILSIMPQHATALHNMGYIEMTVNGNYPQAIEYFSKAIATDPQYVGAVYNKAYTYELMNDKKQARQYYEQVLQIDPEHTKAKERLKKLK